MLITIEKAAEILSKGTHVTLITKDGKLAVVPSDKMDLSISAAEAINLMFYVIRSQDSVEAIRAQLDPLVEAALAKAAEPDPTELRQQKYREIRGLG